MTTAEIDDFADVPYDSLGITIAGVGATMGSTLAIEQAEPIRKHEQAYVLLRTKCEKLSFPDDKEGNQIRVAHLHPEEAFWISAKDAENLAAEQRAERKRLEDEARSQSQLFAEAEAEAREAADGTAAPADVAVDAADRIKRGR